MLFSARNRSRSSRRPRISGGRNGKVYSADAKGSFYEAVAVRGNRIAAVGTTRGHRAACAARQTQVVWMRGGAAVMPGIQRCPHAYAQRRAGRWTTSTCRAPATLDGVQLRIRAFARAHADAAWMRGRGWGYGRFPATRRRAQQLDAAVPDRPAVMRCFDGHSIWVNSLALSAGRHYQGHADPPQRRRSSAIR